MSGSRSSTERLRQSLQTLGFDAEIKHFPEGTRTAHDAATAIGCDVGQIAKSLVFRRADTGGAVLVVASGRNRVDTDKVGALLGAELRKADARFVRDTTGYAIGGVAPFAHVGAVEILIDAGLADYPLIWAAAGSPHAVFAITYDQLLAGSGGRAADIAADIAAA